MEFAGLGTLGTLLVIDIYWRLQPWYNPRIFFSLVTLEGSKRSPKERGERFGMAAATRRSGWFVKVNHAVPSRRVAVSSSKSSGIPWNHISGRAVARPRVGRFLLSSWPLEMDVRMRIHRQGGVRGPSEGLRLAHYQQLWPNGTLRRATRLHRPPPTSGTPAEPSPTARSCPRLPYDNGI